MGTADPEEGPEHMNEKQGEQCNSYVRRIIYITGAMAC
jgi:hypothetical protein